MDTQAIRTRALESLREHRSIVSHYPEDRHAKAVVSFLSLFEKVDATFVDEQVINVITHVRDSTQEMLDGKRSWPVAMTDELRVVNRDLVEVFTQVLEGC